MFEMPKGFAEGKAGAGECPECTDSDSGTRSEGPTPRKCHQTRAEQLSEQSRASLAFGQAMAQRDDIL